MSESDTEININEEVVTDNNDDIILDKDTMDCFLKFKAQQDLKKTRAEKKRLTKKGLPDKRAESSSKNVSKAREKVKEYLALSKAVVDDGDTDEEYIEVCVKKNPKKDKKYLKTKIAPQNEPPPIMETKSLISSAPIGERSSSGSVAKPVVPPKVAPPRVEDSAVYKLMFGQSNPTDLRQQLLRKR